MSGLSDIVNAAPYLYKEGDFSPKKGWKIFFVYILKFVLTLDKTLNTMSLMCKILKSVGRAFWKLFKYLILNAQFSISVVLGSCTQSSGLDERELYAYVAGCTCYIWVTKCVLGYLLHFRPTKTQASMCRIALAFVTNIHKVWMMMKTRNKIWTSSQNRCVESL